SPSGLAAQCVAAAGAGSWLRVGGTSVGRRSDMAVLAVGPEGAWTATLPGPLQENRWMGLWAPPRPESKGRPPRPLDWLAGHRSSGYPRIHEQGGGREQVAFRQGEKAEPVKWSLTGWFGSAWSSL